MTSGPRIPLTGGMSKYLSTSIFSFFLFYFLFRQIPDLPRAAAGPSRKLKKNYTSMKDRIMDPVARAAAQRIAQQAAAVAPSHASLQCLSEIRNQQVEEFETGAAVEDNLNAQPSQPQLTAVEDTALPSQPQLTPAVTVALVRAHFVLFVLFKFFISSLFFFSF